MLFDGAVFDLNLFLLYINIPDDDISNMIPVASATFFSEYYQATNIKHSHLVPLLQEQVPHTWYSSLYYIKFDPNWKKQLGLQVKPTSKFYWTNLLLMNWNTSLKTSGEMRSGVFNSIV